MAHYLGQGCSFRSVVSESHLSLSAWVILSRQIKITSAVGFPMAFSRWCFLLGSICCFYDDDFCGVSLIFAFLCPACSCFLQSNSRRKISSGHRTRYHPQCQNQLPRFSTRLAYLTRESHLSMKILSSFSQRTDLILQNY